MIKMKVIIIIEVFLMCCDFDVFFCDYLIFNNILFYYLVYFLIYFIFFKVRWGFFVVFLWIVILF